MVCRSLFAVCLLCERVLPVEAQQVGPKPMQIAVRGNIMRVGQGKILLTTPSGQNCTLGMTPKTETRLLGMAESGLPHTGRLRAFHRHAG